MDKLFGQFTIPVSLLILTAFTFFMRALSTQPRKSCEKWMTEKEKILHDHSGTFERLNTSRELMNNQMIEINSTLQTLVRDMTEMKTSYMTIFGEILKHLSKGGKHG